FLRQQQAGLFEQEVVIEIVIREPHYKSPARRNLDSMILASNGFMMNSSAPADSALRICGGSVSAELRITRGVLPYGICRSLWQKLRPSMIGIFKSMMMTSGISRSQYSGASRPFSVSEQKKYKFSYFDCNTVPIRWMSSKRRGFVMALESFVVQRVF